MKEGLLSVDLERVVPERLKPRLIEIGATVAKGVENKTIDAAVAANWTQTGAPRARLSCFAWGVRGRS